MIKRLKTLFLCLFTNDVNNIVFTNTKHMLTVYGIYNGKRNSPRRLFMKSIVTLFLIVSFLSPLLATTSFAHDTDLYTASGGTIEPNLLIIFDNSGSMNDLVQAYHYDPLITYDPSVVPQANRDTVYYKGSGEEWRLFQDSISLVPCASARTALTNQGHYEGNTSSNCRSQNRTLRTGNYRNYLASIGGTEYKSKIEITKDVITDFLDTINGVKVGVMVYNYSEGGHLQSEIKSLTDTNRTQLKTDIDNIVASTWTPLAETLYEAGLYFKGGASYFNSRVTYASPIQYYCQKNYVIMITDGISTEDRNSVLGSGNLPNYPKIGDQDKDGREPGGAHEVHYDSNGSDYLDDVAKYLYDTDLRTGLEKQQSITTFTIGFELDTSDPAMAPKAKDLLQRTATHGHGKFYTTSGGQTGLADAFQNIIGEILSKSTSFVAPIVPVSQLEKTTAGDKIYLAFFKPAAGMWSGNIKKFGVQQADNTAAGLTTGDIIDVNGSKAVSSNGQLYSTATSFWTTTAMDGSEVEQGGVGEVLMRRASARSIYTYFYTDVNLTHSSNAFTTGNASITPQVLGFLEGDTSGRDKLINFVHGYDAYDDNVNGNTTEKRDWILGSFLHSRPLIIHYPNPTNPALTRSIIFAGSNGGMLHAFDDSDGRELWGFIPPNVLNKLQALHAGLFETYVDGSPKSYIAYNTDGSINQAILIFGERRGGDRYYALDVTNPDAPAFLWEIGPTARIYGITTFPTADYQELGQTWSIPVIDKVAYGTGEKWVAFISGGYDTNQDNDPVIASDSMGRAIYVIDVLTGEKIWRYTNAENAELTYSIPSDILKVDTDGNGKIDRLYVGDLGGRMWRFDIGDSDVSQWKGKIVFQSNPGANDRRKIFYPPDVTLERDASGDYEMLFFGTGDREAPKESAVINRLYAVKDRNPVSPLGENDLVNVTNGLSPGTPLPNGWYIILENAGEKSLATPVIFFKASYFTTFIPSCEGPVGDPCFVGEGIARLYVVKYNTGNAFFNFDLTNDMGGIVLSESDRSLIIGTAIPSGVIITIIRGTAVAYIGVGGGIYPPELPSAKSLMPVNWRIRF
jgi:type IV pilus assembly protein PilY1